MRKGYAVIEVLKFVVLVIPLLYFFNRSHIGNRNKEQKWPRWVQNLGDRAVPRIVSSDWFAWVAWSSRRVLPFIMAFTILSFGCYIIDGKDPYWLSAPDWLAIAALTTSCFIVYMPFAKKPRRNPLDKWMGTIFGLLFAVPGVLIAVLALTFHFIHIHAIPLTAFGRISRWVSSSSLDNSLGIAGGLLGYGIALLGLVEALPSWRTKVMVVDNSKELEELRLKNRNLETEVRKLRQKPQSKSPNRQRHQQRRKRS